MKVDKLQKLEGAAETELGKLRSDLMKRF